MQALCENEFSEITIFDYKLTRLGLPPFASFNYALFYSFYLPFLEEKINDIPFSREEFLRSIEGKDVLSFIAYNVFIINSEGKVELQKEFSLEQPSLVFYKTKGNYEILAKNHLGFGYPDLKTVWDSSSTFIATLYDKA